ncbi:MAG TPA: CCA tRNA nucleotidyltransferase [Actinomycetota bacterium]|jgi:poly(A) polymerase|nr:CCA tRNA nucleotidyltransferase [Actinomycetota bacterium]
MSATARLPELVAEGSLARDIGERFAQAGYETWLVGGRVRDWLLGLPTPDLDVATDAKPTEMLGLLRGWADELWLQGVRYGTIGALIRGERVEITTYREEWYPEDSRKPEVHFARDIRSDLSRRDFTVNAIAVRTPGGEIFDPTDGLQDLRRKTLRTPSAPDQAFTDDPLRMLRACRFAAALGFDVAEEVVDAAHRMQDRLAIVSRERVRDELSKLLVTSRPSRGLALVVRTGLSTHVIPELDALAMEQDPVHRHKDVLRHTFAVVDGVPATLVARLAALFHDIGKPATRQITDEGVTFHHHEVVGARMAEARLRELRYPNAVVDDVKTLVALHLRFHTYRLGWTDAAVRRYVRDAGHLLDDLNALVRADCTTRDRAKAQELQDRMDALEARITDLAEREELGKIRPPLDGHDVMAFFDLEPSPLVGRGLGFLTELRLERGPMGRKEAFGELERWGAEHGLAPARTAEEATEIANARREEALDAEDDG